MSTQSPVLLGSSARERLLSVPVEHIDCSSFDARPIIDGMRKMSFTARDLGRATEIFNQMLSDSSCATVLTVAGSTAAAGCQRLYADLIRWNMIDAVVATGASVVDMDFFEALGFRHYRGTSQADDEELRGLEIDRIYDTYIDERDLKACDRVIGELADELEPRPYSSREFIREMGRYLTEHAKNPVSLVQAAYEHDVPIFCPAFTDSSAGFGLVMHQERRPDRHLTLDSIRDFRELTQIKIAAGRTGLLMIGGGVPKNFAQDTVVCADLLDADPEMHAYAVQITVADPRDGACSSSTLREACSWGKVGTAREQMVFAEATSVLPLLVSDAYHRGHWQHRERRGFSKLF